MRFLHAQDLIDKCMRSDKTTLSFAFLLKQKTFEQTSMLLKKINETIFHLIN